jgi:hypothetical protein
MSRRRLTVPSIALAIMVIVGACTGRSSSTTKGAVSPAPARTGRLLNAQTGRPMFTGPNGEPGYGGPQVGSLAWTMPDGVKSWYIPGTQASQGNLEALQNAPGRAKTPGDFGSLKGVCGPGTATGATDQGVTDKTIDIGAMSDPGAAAEPGLDQELFDTSTAFAKWCNDAGGIAGRKIVLHLRDAKLFAVAAQTINACGQDFAEVGGATVFDDAGVDLRVKCGLPEIPAFETSAKANDAPLKVMADPTPSHQIDVSMFRGFQHVDPGAVNAGYLAINLPGVSQTIKRTQVGATALGFHTAYDESYSPGGITNPLSYVQRMKAKNVDVLMVVGSPNDLVGLEKAMQTAAWYPKAIVLTLNFYDKTLIANGGDALQNTWITLNFFPFELANRNAPTKQYMDIMAADDPGGKVAAVGIYSWAAWTLFATAARDCGSHLTRACLLTNAGSHTDWTGGGVTSLVNTNPLQQQTAECWMTIRATASGFVSDPTFLPPNSGSFNCDPANVAKINNNFST